MTSSKVVQRIAGASPRQKSFAALCLGAVAALGQSPVEWPFATLLALGGLTYLFATLATSKSAGLLGWLAGSGYFAASMFWIVNPFLVDAEREAWMAPFAWGFMSTGLALFWAAGFWLAFWLGRTPRQRSLSLVLCLTLAELTRSYVLTGFPWGLPAYVWVGTPVMQLASLIGPHGLVFVTLLIAAMPVLFRRSMVGLFIAAIAVGLIWVAGPFLDSKVIPPRPQPYYIRLIQPNAPQREKWDQTHAATFFQRQMDLTAMPSENPPDLVIWPETAVTFWLEDQPNYQRWIAEAAGPFSRVILGAVRFDGQGVFNALAVLDADGRAAQIYDKSHLVPFGEYVPLGDFLARIGLHGFAASDGQGFNAGPGHQLLDLGQGGKVLPLICYEAIFPHLVNGWTSRPDWILQITNDAWFGEIAGPQQHFAQARMRAVEQGLPLVRVANTGVSALIDAKGHVVAMIPLGQSGKLDVVLPGALPRTFYSKTGDWLVLILMLSGISLMWINRRFNL